MKRNGVILFNSIFSTMKLSFISVVLMSVFKIVVDRHLVIASFQLCPIKSDASLREAPQTDVGS